MSRRGKRRDQHHVRLYGWEIRSEAYRSLSPEARALLVEFRALYTGRENRIFMSVRQIRERLGIGQANAQRARDELLDRGFIRLLSPGSFTRKVRHATEYALTNEPMEGESVAPKDYMAWKSTVLETTTNGTQGEYRDQAGEPGKCPHGTQGEYREGPVSPDHGTRLEYTVTLPSGSGEQRECGAVDLTRAALPVGDSMGCPCGGQTVLTTERCRGHMLLYQRCGDCGRCARYVLKRGAEVLAIETEAQRRYLEVKEGAAA